MGERYIEVERQYRAGLDAGRVTLLMTPIDASNSARVHVLARSSLLFQVSGAAIAHDTIYVGVYASSVVYGIPLTDGDELDQPMTKVGAIPSGMLRDITIGGASGEVCIYAASYASGSLWRIPLEGGEASIVASGLPVGDGIALDGKGRAAVVGHSAGLYLVDLATGKSKNAARGLRMASAVAIDSSDPQLLCAYVITQGELWKIPLFGNLKPTLCATGMTGAFCLTLRENTVPSDPQIVAFIGCGNGDLWRIPIGPDISPYIASKDSDLIVKNLGNISSIQLDDHGNGYTTDWDGGAVWKIDRIAPPLTPDYSPAPASCSVPLRAAAVEMPDMEAAEWLTDRRSAPVCGINDQAANHADVSKDCGTSEEPAWFFDVWSTPDQK